MKSYVLRETAGYVYITRNGNPYLLTLGEVFSEDELATIISTSAFTYLCTEDNSITAVDAGAAPAAPAAPTPAPVKPVKIFPVEAPAEDTTTA